jgi:AcrR family transcriptional regulator
MPVEDSAARRERQREELRGAILDATRELFATEGVDTVSMRRLARSIGYSPGTIYLHFASKEELLRCLVEEAFDTLLAELEASRAATPLETLRAGLRAYVAFGLDHPNHYHFAFVLEAPAAPCAYEPHAAFDYLRRCVADCIRTGDIRRTDEQTAAQLLWAAVHGITSLLIARPAFPWVERSRLVDSLVDATLRGLAAPEGDPS